jgi:hypothetical protein
MCLGEAVDKLPGAKPPGTNSKWVPTVGESVDPHYMRTNAKAEERHKQIGVHKPGIPDPPAPPKAPQAAKAPSTTPLKKRNQFGGFAGSETMLTGSNGVDPATLNLGTSSLLGG